MKILVIQGPNLNILGHRDPRIYGPMTLEQIHNNMQEFAKQNKCELDFFQSNFEGEIIDKIQECIGGEYQGIVINPGAYAHTSVAIADAIASSGVPAVEVHLSNIFAREDYRKVSYTGAVTGGVITGFGAFGYHLALISILQIIGEIEAIKAAQAEAQKENA
ncbi:type II 3-dehydroquinate dehydratase [Helicobacter mustelae]|uniref:3-dehydroquinate dehydratase n=1 Tax=Helicobacter mustelae (strain ATCC 43772 / CCUG 25715 / CIP 103759 / LMG 18044 / NCTC 12198 / R85-136P) TaxID=679897 RepID=D3UJ63_HELM1|nr:type II 3-dehydroquinate dehydratase [Helicobacter mustelae]CBG40538.1 3-dehydroquinate dehydratase [Helicobacter mustelae 12198]SQH72036.1 3-dehydroquinate dehydratase [Helicobacter mustelae]STP13179.1 3-dehydroquinate dehydratase [Helicobacter mustelae]